MTMAMTNDKKDLLRKVSLFADLSDDQIAALSRVTVSRRFPKDAMIFEEGDFADALYMVEKGKVKVLLSDADGHDVIISILQTGECFGEMALVDSEVRSARVVTMTPSEVLMISKAEFQRWLTGHPEISMALMQELARRLRSANRTIGSLAMLDVGGRVARVLLDAAEQADGQLIVRDPPTQKDIASMVGASREMVNRTFKELVRQGRISQTGRIIVIHEPADQFTV